MKGPVALVRHPAVADGAGRCYGRLDLPLADPASIAPLLAALEPMRGAAILTSPLARCRLVAEALAADWGSVPHIDPRLLEIDFGAWEGLPWDDIPRADLDLWARDLLGFAPPGGETGAALVARVAAFWQRLEAPAVVVTHGGPLKVLLALAAGEPVDLARPSPPPGSVASVC
ncbi:MAG: phosphoglycerate mutase [Proteobacteria bacterium]|nr:phosphoglycerate mutase [Pseudomonadota bacterium]